VIASRWIDWASGIAGWLGSEQAVSSKSASEGATHFAEIEGMVLSKKVVPCTLERGAVSVNAFVRVRLTPVRLSPI
jgi:hypothetical protein